MAERPRLLAKLSQTFFLNCLQWPMLGGSKLSGFVGDGVCELILSS